MKKKSLKNIFLITLISIFLLIFNVRVKQTMFVYAECIMSAFMLVVVFFSIQMFGIQKDKNTRLKSGLFFQVAQILALYFIVIYLLGLYFGFSKIVFSLRPMSILNNTFAPIVTFVCLELFRYIIINNNRDKKGIIALFSIIIGLLELSVSVKYLQFGTFKDGYKTFADYILPVAIKQLALGSICYNGGLKPVFLYRMIMVLYTYIIPIHPSFSPTMLCMCNILLPVLLLIKTSEIVEEEKREKEYITKDRGNVLESLLSGAILVSVVLLISGITPIGIVAIASESMQPTFSRGAGVITLDIEEEDLKEGDIITFNSGSKQIIHRISTIEKVEDEIRYYTKGDANTTVDSGYITFEDIDNKIILSIPLVGYPSLIINDLLSR